MTPTELDAFIDAYRTVLAAGDEAGVRALFADVTDESIDPLLERLDAAGLDVPEVDVNGQLVVAALREAGATSSLAEQLESVTDGSFEDFVRARAHALGMRADTIVGLADDTGILDPDSGLDAAYAYVHAILGGGEIEIEVDPAVIAALAQVLDTSGATLTSFIDR